MSKLTKFCFQRNFSDKGDCFLVLAGSKWTNYLLQRNGISGEPFFERESLKHEPEAFPNGHPYAWIYRNLEDLLRDECRWSTEAQLQDLRKLAESAVAAAEQMPIRPTIAALPESLFA